MQSNSLKIRLSASEIQQIKSVIQSTLEFHALLCQEIALFGSRTDPAAKGGDIDLYIRYDNQDPKRRPDLFKLKADLKMGLIDHLGEQKIDLIFDDGKKSLGAFAEIINETKVVLWTSPSEKNS